MPDNTKIQHSGPNDPKRIFVKRAGTFTGDAYGEPRITDTGIVTVNTVEFLPNSRTNWHHHESGQILVITAGRGFVGTRDGTIYEVAAGDVVWTPPGLDHYHGARSDSYLVHEAVSIGETEWLEPVPDEVYGKKA